MPINKTCNHTFYNQGMIEELEEENVILQALLSCATGVWYSSEDDNDKEDSLVISSVQAESMEGK